MCYLQRRHPFKCMSRAEKSKLSIHSFKHVLQLETTLDKEHKRNLPARWHKDRALFKATDVQTVELIPVHSLLKAGVCLHPGCSITWTTYSLSVQKLNRPQPANSLAHIPHHTWMHQCENNTGKWVQHDLHTPSQQLPVFLYNEHALEVGCVPLRATCEKRDLHKVNVWKVKFFLQTWMIYWETAALHVVCAAMWVHVTSASVSPPLDGTELIANPVVSSGMLKIVLVSHLMLCLFFHLISHTKLQVELYINTRHLYFCRSYDPLSPKTSNSLYLHFVLLT